MALALINKPIGHKLTGTELEANIYDDGTGTAIVYTGTSHGRSDGDYVYIQSDFDSYNGFKYVDSISYDYFKILESETGDYVQYVQDAEIEYQVSILEHGFIAVHQPIVYEIESSIFPTNTEEESYTPNTVDSFSDADGYTQLELDQALTDPTELSKIELVGSGELAGVYQIITVLQPWSVVIDLAYDATNDFSGYIIVKYYDNYAINVNVYAGLSTDHRWTAVKPYELAATLKFIPDNDNKTKFSISEILRSYINNRNNLTLDTLPNNLDFIVGFYIEYFESYDVSDGEDITTFEGEVTTDDFVGYALNSKLEFKTESISHLSEYVSEGVYYSQWMTLFETPIIMVGKFFDISFLNRYNGVDILIKKGGLDYLTIQNPGIGIIRVPLEAQAGEEEICIIAYVVGEIEINLSGFANNPDTGTDWTTGEQPSVGGTNLTDILFMDYDFIDGVTYTLISVFTQSGSSTVSFTLSSYNDSFVAQHTGTNNTPVGTESVSVSFTAGPDDTKIGFRKSVSIGASTIVVNSLTIEVEEQQVTEEICLNVIEECESTYIPDDVRLLEDGSYRLLE